MPMFKIPVVRIGYAARDIEVEAADDQEARQIALETAGNQRFIEHDAEYEPGRMPQAKGRHPLPEPDLMHIIFNGGQSDESQGIVSLRRGTWLFYTWGQFSGHHANGPAGVETLGITDDDFRLLLGDGDDPNGYHELANWDHVVELLNCPAFQLEQRLGGTMPPDVELLVVVKGQPSQSQIKRLEAIVGQRTSDVTRIGDHTDVLFHIPGTEAARLSAMLEKLGFVASIAIHQSG
jgi:hypothetical protein